MSNKFHEMAALLAGRAGLLLDAYQAHWLDASVQLAPLDEGDLKASGTLVDGGGEFERRIAFTAAHAKHQEFGTMYMPPQPYARPAKEALRGPLKRDAGKLVGK